MRDVFNSPMGDSGIPGAPEGGADDQDLGAISYVKEALKLQYNWIALAGAAAFALVAGSGLPLVLAAGLELIYLSLVPQNKRFQRLVRSWKYAEEKQYREMKASAIFQELPPELRKRYAALETICRAIRDNYSRLSSTSQIFAGQMEQKLQDLLQAYVRMLVAAQQYRDYAASTDPEAIKRDAAQLERKLGSDAPKVQEINRKRIEILNKRLEKYEKIRENRQVIDAQLAAIQDVLELIRDQSITMRDPQQISDQLENLVRDVGQTEETVKQVEAIFDMASPELAEPLASVPTDTSDAGPADRTRLRN